MRMWEISPCGTRAEEKSRTRLLWSLTLMIRSFLRRSHTEAFPPGLAEARMCWTCLFHDTQLMSSTGFWNKNILEHDLQAKGDDNPVMEQRDGQKKKIFFFLLNPDFWCSTRVLDKKIKRYFKRGFKCLKAKTWSKKWNEIPEFSVLVPLESQSYSSPKCRFQTHFHPTQQDLSRG